MQTPVTANFKKNILTKIPDGYYPLMEKFYTIQGEGYHTGKPAFFIRLAGCDVGCVWCDVKDSWEASASNLIAVNDLLKDVAESKTPNVVITGGEPAAYNLTTLTNALSAKGYKVWLETSGAYPLYGNFDWICVSPKKFKPPMDSVLQKASELKVVVFNESDFEWAEENASKVSDTAKLFLQPEYSRLDRVMPGIIDYVKRNPQWSISLQTHKYLNIP